MLLLLLILLMLLLLLLWIMIMMMVMVVVFNTRFQALAAVLTLAEPLHQPFVTRLVAACTRACDC